MKENRGVLKDGVLYYLQELPTLAEARKLIRKHRDRGVLFQMGPAYAIMWWDSEANDGLVHLLRWNEEEVKRVCFD